MKTDDSKLLLLKEAVEQTFGSTPGSPTDFDTLSERIQLLTGRQLGISTLKRLWGYVNSPHKPTYTTLSILARYAGYRDWHSFCMHYRDTPDSVFNKESLVMSADIIPGSITIIEWDDDKCCTLKKMPETHLFQVVKANNIKLQPDDLVCIQSFGIGEPFIATACRRGNKLIGRYVGARKDGIRKIILQG